MKAINQGNKYNIYDSSVKTYDKLPPQTYQVCHSINEGFYLTGYQELSIDEKTYGVHTEKVEKVNTAFETSERNLGIILSGDKGIGKSLFAKMLCINSINKGYPVIIVNEALPGIGRFIQSIDQEAVILFDEFDKVFDCRRKAESQVDLLSLFDGFSTGKKMFIVTCNGLNGLNEFLLNRPGRFHYHFRFDYPTEEAIREYLTDKVPSEYLEQIEKVITFSRKVKLNYDCLRAIAFELSMGYSFSDAIKDLNILAIDNEEFYVYAELKNGMKSSIDTMSINLYEECVPGETYHENFYFRNLVKEIDEEFYYYVDFDPSKCEFSQKDNAFILNADKFEDDGLTRCRAADAIKKLKNPEDYELKRLVFMRKPSAQYHYTV